MNNKFKYNNNNKRKNYNPNNSERSILLTIKKIGINGEGIGYYKRKAVFVPGAIIGDVVNCKVVNEKHNYIEAEIAGFKEKSEDRERPLCYYYRNCGGCQLMHVKYEKQLEYKRDILIESLERYLSTKETYNVDECLGYDNPYFYRNKSSLPVRYDGTNTKVGIYQHKTNKLIHIDKCVVQHKSINRINTEICKLTDEHNIYAFNPKDNKGLIRYIVLRSSVKEDKVLATIVCTRKSKVLDEYLKDISNIKGISGVYLCINSDFHTHEILTDDITLIHGKKVIQEQVNDLVFNLRPRSFFQLNTLQNKAMIDHVKSNLSKTKNEVLLDAYCGVGSIGLSLAKEFKKIIGIDNNKEAIMDAKENADINKITNAEFYTDKVERLYPKLLEKGTKIDTLIVDPPRVGLDSSFIDVLLKNKVDNLIYISCNPATLAKNLNLLKQSYKIKKITPLDMFSHTSLVESITILVKR